MLKVVKDYQGRSELKKKESSEFTVEGLKEVMPRGYRGYIDDNLVDKLNRWGEEDSKEETEWYRENFCTYLGVIEGRNVSLDRYIKAVKYCSLRLLGVNIIDSWTRTFPEKVDRVKKDTEGDDELFKSRCQDYATAYNTTKLVVMIMGQSLVPSYIVNAPYYQEAINKLVEIIRDKTVRNGMTKVKACEAILNATKQPEVIENNVNVNFGVGGITNSAMDELREVTNKLAMTLKEQVANKSKDLRELTDIELVKGDDWDEHRNEE